MKQGLKNPLMRASVAVTTFLISTGAHAQLQSDGTYASGSGGSGGSQSLASLTDSASSNVYALTTLISTASYVTGTAFAMGGLLSLKKAAEEPGREPIHKGVGRLCVGAALVTLPSIISVAIVSMGIDPTQQVGVTNSDLNRLN